MYSLLNIYNSYFYNDDICNDCESHYNVIYNDIKLCDIHLEKRKYEKKINDKLTFIRRKIINQKCLIINCDNIDIITKYKKCKKHTIYYLYHKYGNIIRKLSPQCTEIFCNNITTHYYKGFDYCHYHYELYKYKNVLNKTFH